jgi:hypothetical protein
MDTGRKFFKAMLVPILLPVALHAQQCEKLSQLGSSTVSITKASVVDGGDLAIDGSADGTVALTGML